MEATIKALADLINEKKCGPIIIRLAWHDAGTYCASTKTGGPRGCMRFEGTGESMFGANAGLDVARKLLQPIKDEYAKDMSYADFWALASIVAIKEMGGPVIPFRPGRKDAASAEECVEEGRHPPGDQGSDMLRSIFAKRMGMSDEDIVALSGAHTLGHCHADRSGFEGAWTADPYKFDNSYFVDLLEKKWVPTKSSKGCPQFKDEETGNFMMLAPDIALIEDKDFRAIVEKYAKDEAAFFAGFSSAYQKLLEMGVSGLGEPISV